jgi:hypothetical protein
MSDNEDLKAKMREALERKKGAKHPDDSAGAKSKTHGPEVVGGAPKMHRMRNPTRRSVGSRPSGWEDGRVLPPIPRSEHAVRS